MTTKTKSPKKENEIEITGTGKYPLVPLSAINIVERPSEGEESDKIFFNPRSLGSFTSDKMSQLQYSIRADGLQQPPIVRAIYNGGSLKRVELIAGERRIRCCQGIFADNLPCFDEDQTKPKTFSVNAIVIYRGRFGVVVSHVDSFVTISFDADHIGSKETKPCDYNDVYPTVLGKDFYAKVPCKVVNECNDQRALRLAFTENDQSEPLTIQEEVQLVERLEKLGKRQEEIAEMLGSNVTWVSQTSNFRTQLPKEAYEKLLCGQMTRHVAVSFLSFAPEDRGPLLAASVIAEAQETAAKIKEHQGEVERYEDEEEIHLAEAKRAQLEGDDKEVARQNRKAVALQKKAQKEQERLDRAKTEKGTLRQGHVKKGAATEGLTPKKSKAISLEELLPLYLSGIEPYLDSGFDKLTGEEVPNDMAAMVRRVVLALQAGCRDPLQPIREYMWDTEQWDRPASYKGSQDGEDNELTDFDMASDDADFEDMADITL